MLASKGNMVKVKPNYQDRQLQAHCTVCGAEYSADPGDYWDWPDVIMIKCCNEPCILGHSTVIFAICEVK